MFYLRSSSHQQLLTDASAQGGTGHLITELDFGMRIGKNLACAYHWKFETMNVQDDFSEIGKSSLLSEWSKPLANY
jgi:hypothetical protein